MKKPTKSIELVTARLEITESSDLRASVALSHNVIDTWGDILNGIVTNPAFLPGMLAAISSAASGQPFKVEDYLVPSKTAKSSKPSKPKSKRASAKKETP
jgi:hypothetical protein